MTQFLKLTLPWNRGAGWTPQSGRVLDWHTFAGFEVPLTEGVHESEILGYIPPDDIFPAACIPFGSHVVSADASPEDQAHAVAEILAGDLEAPLMILPPTAPLDESLTLISETVAAMVGLGLNPRILYMPEYFWRDGLKSPDLYAVLRSGGTGVPLALMIEPDEVLWSADASGEVQRVYPGDDSAKWAGYGGVRSEEIAFMSIKGADFAAYRGTHDQLAALLATPPAPAAPTAPAPFPESLLRGPLLATGPDKPIPAAPSEAAPAAPSDATTAPVTSGLAGGLVGGPGGTVTAA